MFFPLLGKVMTTMTKTGRNDPCPCGSGKKYKRCCQEKDEAEKSAARAAAQAAQQAALQAQQAESQARYEAARKAFIEKTRELDAYSELANASNAVIDMVRAGRLDEAEAAARDLLVRYPDVHDGYDRLGMVYEARGDYKHAVECYRQVIDFVRARPDQYEPQFEDTFHRLIAKLDPSTAS
jgi:tetratricopeptide (TPR) repeat protein